MLRYASLGLIALTASGAWAQQVPPAGAPAVASSPVPAPAAKPVIPMEEPRAGDRWTYELRDEITGKSRTQTQTVTEVAPKETTVRVQAVGTTGFGTNVYDRSWNLISTGPWKYAPNDGTGILAPLAAGKSWNFHANDSNAGGATFWARSGSSKIVGQERLTTRAGVFDTFKIETDVSSRNVNNPNMTNDLALQTWYAPAIDHWVKRVAVTRTNKHVRYNSTVELIDYGRGGVSAQATAPAAPSTPTASEPAKAVVAMGPMQSGDRWVYEVRDEITGLVTGTRTLLVTDLTPAAIAIRSTDAGKPEANQIMFDRSWNLVQANNFKYSPNDGTGVQLPLAVGKTWSFRTSMTNPANGNILNRSGNAKVVGQEKLTTKAGTFETFKIETTYSVASVRDPTQKADSTLQTWYAPAINRWVKRTAVQHNNKHLTSNTTFELVDYGRDK